MRRFRKVTFALVLLVLLATPLLASAQATTYVVQRGDTLLRIAVRYNTTVQAIAAANNIYNPNHIYAGQVLVIPSAVVNPPTYPPAAGAFWYTVRQGDRLGQIAAAYNTTIYAIAANNRLSNPNLIYAGQRLYIIPGQGTRIARYVVQHGDQLRFIAARYGTTWQLIASYNGLYNPNLIYAGQVLQIPY
ncbi:LysM peptidoglycan-binding domain-containing protein [Anaerolineae bacterium CFX9]|nr:LysM peptidoglycan-binding domain-containing protein [Anaerolineae bacterium CFX9]